MPYIDFLTADAYYTCLDFILLSTLAAMAIWICIFGPARFFFLMTTKVPYNARV